MTSKTLLIIKPDAYEKREEILKLVEESGFEVEFEEDYEFDERSVKEFYSEHVGKDFFKRHEEFMCSGPCYLVVLSQEGTDAIQNLRTLLGATNPSLAAVGTVRQLYGSTLPCNAAHSSDSLESFEREVQVLNI